MFRKRMLNTGHDNTSACANSTCHVLNTNVLTVLSGGNILMCVRCCNLNIPMTNVSVSSIYRHVWDGKVLIVIISRMNKITDPLLFRQRFLGRRFPLLSFRQTSCTMFVSGYFIVRSLLVFRRVSRTLL